MATDTVTGARRDLGAELRRERGVAGYTQSHLASRTGYSRSQVANAEIGQGAARAFWRACDTILSTGVKFSTAYDEIETLRYQRKVATEAAERVRRASEAQQQRQGGQSAGAPATEADPPEVSGSVVEALHSTLAESPDGTGDHVDQALGLERRVLNAHRNRGRRFSDRLSLTLVGGFAGSGKSEFARFLSRTTGWTILDKDTATRALVEQLLISLGGDPNDRHTELYKTRARPHEYRCLLDQAVENLASGVSIILTAPFLKEYQDESWLQRVQNRCVKYNAEFTVVWVRCDVESMYDYIEFRGASRDAWKLANWDEYLSTIDPDFEPAFPHCTIDNGLNAAVALAEQAERVANAVTDVL